MELQFNKSRVRYLTDAAGDVRNTELTHEGKLPDGMPDIGRVLTSWGQVVIRSKEWNRDEIIVTGGLMVWTLYVPEDGTEVRSVENWIPFQLKWEIPSDAREGIIRVAPMVRFVDSRGISARKIMIRAGIAAMGQAFSPADCEVSIAGEVPEDVEVLTRVYPVKIPAEAGERAFLLDEEVTLPESQPQVEKILSVSLNPVATEKKVLGGKAVFKGNGNLHLVYRCPEGRVRTCDWELPFSQYAQLDGDYSPDAGADIRMAVTNLETDLLDAGKIRLKAGLLGQYLIDEQQLLELTEDAYSPMRDLELSCDALNMPSVLEERRESLIAEQKIAGQTGQSVDVNFLPDYPRIHRNGQNIRLEVPAVFQVLYYGEDGSLQSSNIRWEGSLQIPAEEETSVQVHIPANGKGEMTAEPDAMNLTGTIPIQLRTMAGTNLPMVTGLTLGEIRQPEESRPSLVLCRAGNETLWDIAKRCGSTVSAIREANDLQSDPPDNRMLLVPVS